ncbi:MAG: CotH kinase family protein [Alphaproteobacteria bacterium]|nr:CotH kinase family protein [Alphaproteobacteria bacterium]
MTPVLLALLVGCGPVSLDLPEGDSGDRPAPGVRYVEDGPPESVGGLPQLDVFSEEEIHDLVLELDRDAWDDLQRNPGRYVEADFTAAGVTYAIGVRLKGTSTFEDISRKPSLKLRFDYVHEGQRFYGMRKLNLHNLTLDPILSSETMTYGFFRAADLPAPRVGYARLRINGDDVGLYTIVEVPEDDFLRRWFADADGNLYENAENYCDLTRVGCFDAEETDEGNDDALQDLIDAAGQTGSAWRTAMQAQMDWDRFVGFMAMERTIAHWDSYSFDLSNYRLYHDPTADTWAFIPWSADLGFGYRPWSYPDCGRHGVDPAAYDMGRLASSCQADAVCREDVLERMLEYADLIDAMNPGALVDAALDRVRPEAETDPDHAAEMDHFEEHGACVRQFLVDRPDVIRQWVAEAGG